MVKKNTICPAEHDAVEQAELQRVASETLFCCGIMRNKKILLDLDGHFPMQLIHPVCRAQIL